MRWLMAHVLPHVPFATRADAAADSFVFMALDPSLDGIGRKLSGEKHESSPSPESYDLEKARRFWELASQLTGWMRPERNAFWVSVYWLRTDPPGGTTAGKRPERRDHVLRRQDDRRLKAISASPMKFRTPPLTQATASAEAGVFSFMPPPDPASPTCLIRPAGPGPAGAARHEIPATDGSS